MVLRERLGCKWIFRYVMNDEDFFNLFDELINIEHKVTRTTIHFQLFIDFFLHLSLDITIESSKRCLNARISHKEIKLFLKAKSAKQEQIFPSRYSNHMLWMLFCYQEIIFLCKIIFLEQMN